MGHPVLTTQRKFLSASCDDTSFCWIFCIFRTNKFFLRNKTMSELNDTQIEEDHENDESTPLLISQIPKKSFFRRHKRCSIFCLAAFFVILAVALTIYFGYYHGIVTLKVFAFNVWGMPGGLGGCKYKKERMIALANVIQSGTPYFDILLMEELWMEADHSTLANASKQAGFYMTEFRELASR